MSLLNDMLKDLEGQNKVTIKVPSKPVGLPIENKFHRMIRIFSITVIIATMTALAINFFDLKRTIQKPIEKKIESEVKNPKLIKNLSQASDAGISEKTKSEKTLENKRQEPIVLPSQIVEIPILKRFSPPSLHERNVEKYHKAMEFANDSRWQQAISLLWQIIESDSEFIQAYQSLAAFQLQQGQIDSARNLLLKGLHLSPNNYDMRKMLAHIYGESGSLKKALAVLMRNAPPIGNDPEYYALLAAYLQKNDNSEKSAEVYRSLIKIEPANGTYWLGYAVALESINKLNEAQKAYQKVLNSFEMQPILQAYAAERLNVLKGYT
jgi:tetratricopeptide (TPR) repeat protein